MENNFQSAITLLSALVELLKLVPQLENPIVSETFALGFVILAAALLIQCLNERQRLGRHTDQINSKAE